MINDTFCYIVNTCTDSIHDDLQQLIHAVFILDQFVSPPQRDDIPWHIFTLKGCFFEGGYSFLSVVP